MKAEGGKRTIGFIGLGGMGRAIAQPAASGKRNGGLEPLAGSG